MPPAPQRDKCRSGLKTYPSRLQLEGTYLNAEFDPAAANFADRVDFSVEALHILRSNCEQNSISWPFDIDGRTVMIGSSYSFNGDRLTVDRQGAAPDMPDSCHGCQAGSASVWVGRWANSSSGNGLQLFRHLEWQQQQFLSHHLVQISTPWAYARGADRSSNICRYRAIPTVVSIS